MTDDGSDDSGFGDAGAAPADDSSAGQDWAGADAGSGDWGAADGGGADAADSGFGDAAGSMAAWQDPSGGGAEQEKARVVGWYASCMFVDGSSLHCRFSHDSVDQDGANTAAAGHRQSYPDHANAVVVNQST